MRSVLISIRPEWVEKIANGEKTIEVRKTRPKVALPFKCYIYCTKDTKTQFWTGPRYSYADDHSHNAFDKCGNGKVIGEFVCNGVERIVRVGAGSKLGEYCICDYAMNTKPLDKLIENACLTRKELEDYLDGRAGYGWRISDLRIYDRPMDLHEFASIKVLRDGFELRLLERPPQSWCNVVRA